MQTYQTLQPDPSDQMIFLLSQIAGNLNTPGSFNTSTRFSSSFTPAPSSVRTNVLWLMSLVLSLTTVLIAIVSSQWLTEHQHYPSHMPVMEKFALFHMRQEALIKWHVPKILSSVALLLLLSLVLFFVGLINFATSFVQAVSVPVIIITCFPLTFIALTTSLPMLQIISLSFSTVHASTGMPAQCPYKSTQSKVMQRFLTLSSSIFLVHLAPFMLLWCIPRHLGRLIGRRGKYRHFRGIPFFLTKNRDNAGQRAYKKIHEFWTADSWIAFDVKWMQFRSAYIQSIESLGKLHWAWLLPNGGMYDSINGVLNARERLNSDGYSRSISIALYHGLEDLHNHYAAGLSTGNNLLFQKMLYRAKDRKRTFYSLSYDDPDNQALRKEETFFIFLSQIHSFQPYGIIQNRLLELWVRLLNYSIARSRITRNSKQPLIRLPLHLTMSPEDPSGYFIPGPLSDKGRLLL